MIYSCLACYRCYFWACLARSPGIDGGAAGAGGAQAYSSLVSVHFVQQASLLMVIRSVNSYCYVLVD
jgi:hypothetical protein